MATKSVRVMGDIVLVETDEGTTVWSTDGQRMRLVPDDGGLAAFTEAGLAKVSSELAVVVDLIAEDHVDDAVDRLRRAADVLNRALAWQRKVDGKEAA